MTSSKRRRRAAAKREEIARCKRDETDRRERASTKRDERAREISTALRAALVIWEIVQVLIHEHVLHGTGPWRLL